MSACARAGVKDVPGQCVKDVMRLNKKAREGWGTLRVVVSAEGWATRQC